MKKLLNIGFLIALLSLFTNWATAARTPKVTVTTNTGNTICLGTNVTFSATVSYATNVTYQWHRLRAGKWVMMKDGDKATLTTISIQNGDEFRCAVVARLNGRKYNIHGSLFMTVNPLPAKPAAITGPDSVFVGSIATYSTASTGGNWISNDVTKATVSANGRVTAVTPGSASINYKVSNAYGCTSTAAHVLFGSPAPAIPNFSYSPSTIQTDLCTATSITSNKPTFTNTSGPVPSQLYSLVDLKIKNSSTTNPISVVADGINNIYVLDLNDNSQSDIKKYDAKSQSWSIIVSSASFNGPNGMTIDNKGNLYVINAPSTGNAFISKITNGSWAVSTYLTLPTGQQPNGAITFNSNTLELYYFDENNNKIDKISTSANTPTSVDFLNTSTLKKSYVSAMTLNPKNDAIYLTDYIGVNGYIEKIPLVTTSGTTTSGTISSQPIYSFRLGNGTGQIGTPNGIAVDAATNIYISDGYNGKVHVYSGFGYSLLAGGSSVTPTYPCLGGLAKFYNPCGIALDNSGHLWVADNFGNDVLSINVWGWGLTFMSTSSKTNSAATINGVNGEITFPLYSSGSTPKPLDNGKYDMIITGYNYSGQYTAPFTVNIVSGKPTITNFTPNKGVSGNKIKITGTNLSLVTGVKIGNVAVSSFTYHAATSSNVEYIEATVASGTTTDNIYLSVNCGDVSSIDVFTVVSSPTITSFTPHSPNTVACGQTVEISGSNLQYVKTVSCSVAAVGASAAFTDNWSLSSTQTATSEKLWAIVGNGGDGSGNSANYTTQARSGFVNVANEYSQSYSTSSFPVIRKDDATFNYIGWGIDYANSTKTNEAGTIITVKGFGFGASANNVKGVSFGSLTDNISATFTLVNDNQIQAVVPTLPDRFLNTDGSANVKVIITNNWGCTISYDFKVKSSLIVFDGDIIPDGHGNLLLNGTTNNGANHALFVVKEGATGTDPVKIVAKIENKDFGISTSSNGNIYGLNTSGLSVGQTSKIYMLNEPLNTDGSVNPLGSFTSTPYDVNYESPANLTYTPGTFPFNVTIPVPSTLIAWDMTSDDKGNFYQLFSNANTGGTNGVGVIYYIYMLTPNNTGGYTGHLLTQQVVSEYQFDSEHLKYYNHKLYFVTTSFIEEIEIGPNYPQNLDYSQYSTSGKLGFYGAFYKFLVGTDKVSCNPNILWYESDDLPIKQSYSYFVSLGNSSIYKTQIYRTYGNSEQYGIQKIALAQGSSPKPATTISSGKASTLSDWRNNTASSGNSITSWIGLGGSTYETSNKTLYIVCFPNHIIAVNDANEATPVLLKKSNSFLAKQKEGVAKDLSVNLYPNPSTSFANLQISGLKESAIASVTIQSFQGKKVWDKQGVANSTIALPIENLSAGIYLITVTNGTEQKTTRWIKTK